MRGQIESAIGMKIAPFVLPLAVTIFVFILVSNWLSVFPWQYGDERQAAPAEVLKPPAADINFVLALALFVFFAYHAAGIWRRGLLGHPWKVLKGHVDVPDADQHRRGDRQADLVVAATFRQHLRRRHPGGADRVVGPRTFMWAPNAIWKTFDLFVGLIQAFIFSLLTILYFSQSMELDHEDDH